jgi:putative ABC transport system permease protein
MESLLQDLRYGFRMLWKSPGFTLAAVLALVLGIGANTAIFSIVNAVLLRPLPFPQSERLMVVAETNPSRGVKRSAVSYPDFADWREQNHVFERMASYHDSDFILTGSGEPLRVQGAVVNADLFPLLGVAPKVGRNFVAEEDKPSESGRAVILSHALWQKQFSADPNIINRAITLDQKSYTVVGVMPEGFQFPIENSPIELWTTVAVDMTGSEPMSVQRGAHYMNVIGRLKPGVTEAQARADLDTIGSRLSQQYPDTNAHRGVDIIPALESLVGDVRPALLILLGAVGCVLLIACANVANLLLARATTRHKEIAIRSALGASRLRVVRQLLTESILLAFAGGALGLLVALWGADLLVKISGDEVPRAAQIGLDARVLGFTLLVSLGTGILFGLAPALQASKFDLTSSLKEGGRSSAEGAGGRNRVRSVLIVAEVAIALVLLVGAGLLVQSLRRLQQVSPGFDPSNVLTLTVSLPEVRYNTQQQADFYRQLRERVTALPGVVSASVVNPLPLSGDRMGVTFETEGRPLPKSELPVTELRTITPDYFRTMSIPLIKGRDFTERDDKSATGAIIVNEAFAQKYFPQEDPLGKRIKPGISTDDTKPIMREIVGVVGNVKHKSLSAAPDPEAYLPTAQVPFDSMILVVKTAPDVRSLINAVRGEVRALDKDLPVYNVKLLEDYVAASVAQPRFNTLLLTVFASLALVLTAVGLYGVMSYSVIQRKHEIGLRMALGAQVSDVFKLVVGQGMTLVLIGIGLGLIGAFALTRLLANLLYGVSSIDPTTFIGISLLIAMVAFIACLVPARRATKVDPMVALRYE